LRVKVIVTVVEEVSSITITNTCRFSSLVTTITITMFTSLQSWSKNIIILDTPGNTNSNTHRN